MNHISKIIAGAAAGALVMYFFDPNRGKRRRTAVCDAADKAYRDSAKFVDGVAKDVTSRVDEAIGETRSALAKGTRVTRQALAGVADRI